MEAALDLVVGKLAQHIQNETALVLNFRQDFKWLKMHLAMLTTALQFADENYTHNDAVKQWIEDVRDTLWDAQDILEVGETLSRSSPQLMIFGYDMGLKKISELKWRYTMGRKIREIKERTESIVKTANELKLIRDMACFETRTLASTPQPRGMWKTRSPLIEYGSFPVAIDINVQQIIERLADPEVQVVGVVGMGGIGKTFLVRHVYNKVKHMYEDFIWLCVSNTYSLELLQGDLAHALNLHDLVGVSCARAAEGIHARLENKVCLIVIDDIWRATQQDDFLTNLGIPIGVNKQCKVIVTSRNKEIFSHLDPSIYEMPLLSAKDSWKLFCAHAFSNSQKNCPKDKLEILAHQIEEKCGRLPLAIKTVASSLAKATTSREWESKLNQLKKVGGVNPYDPILKLSYYWLPSFLKPCFVYLSFFSEDEVIDCEYLVNLWIAEGFIPQTEDQLNMAWDYLRQLANLCLVDVWESVYSSDPYIEYSNTDMDYLHKYCRVHDLVLEIAVDMSKENKFAFSAQDVARKGKKSGCRRILLAKKGIDSKAIARSNLCCPEVVRTLSLSNNPISYSIPPFMLSNAKVLRVLDLSHTSILTLPESTGDLKLLRLLNLSHTKLEQVPQCVRKLKSLCFLDVSHCSRVCRLPLWIGELVCLQHLNIEGINLKRSRRIPKGVSKLMSLCTLRSSDPLELSVEDDEYLRLEDIGNMTCLQELRIEFENEMGMRSLAQEILGGLVKMRTLGLWCLAPIPLPETIIAMKDLQKLYLHGKFTVPGWIRGFENLRVLDLQDDCDCTELFPALETMDNLTVLKLDSNGKCRKFPKAFGKRGGFPNLRVFHIYFFQVLEELPEMEDGAMASLETLRVYDCPMVKTVPRGFQGLKRLREFWFIQSGTDEYRSRLKEEWSTVEASNQHLAVYIR